MQYSKKIQVTKFWKLVGLLKLKQNKTEKSVEQKWNRQQKVISFPSGSLALKKENDNKKKVALLQTEITIYEKSMLLQYKIVLNLKNVHSEESVLCITYHTSQQE